MFFGLPGVKERFKLGKQSLTDIVQLFDGERQESKGRLKLHTAQFT